MKIAIPSCATAFVVASTLISSPLRAQNTPQPSNATYEGKYRPAFRISSSIGTPRNPAVVEAERKGLEAQTRGELLLKEGKLKEAIAAFQESLSYDSTNGLASQLLAEAYTATGQLGEAVDTYRAVMYGRPGVGNNQGGNASVVMQFALVLLKTNNIEEAIVWYQHGADLMNGWPNYKGSKPFNKINFPRFGTNLDKGEIRYTPQRLQALAYVAISKSQWNMNERESGMAHFREAVRLYPESPIPHFFLGEYGAAEGDAKAAYVRAAQLGDDKVKAAAYKEIRSRR